MTPRDQVADLWARRHSLSPTDWLNASPVLLGYCVAAYSLIDGDPPQPGEGSTCAGDHPTPFITYDFGPPTTERLDLRADDIECIADDMLKEAERMEAHGWLMRHEDAARTLRAFSERVRGLSGEPPVLELTRAIPDELTEQGGAWFFDCRVCGEPTEWPDEPDTFDPEGEGLVCGGSPRCCP